MDLEVSAKDEKSAIAQIEVVITSDGEETAKEILFKENSLEEREKYKERLLPYIVVAQENSS